MKFSHRNDDLDRVFLDRIYCFLSSDLDFKVLKTNGFNFKCNDKRTLVYLLTLSQTSPGFYISAIQVF